MTSLIRNERERHLQVRRIAEGDSGVIVRESDHDGWTLLTNTFAYQISGVQAFACDLETRTVVLLSAAGIGGTP